MSLAKTILLAWDWEPSIIIGCAALAIGYAVLARFRLQPKALFYYAGLSIMFLALVSPLDTLADNYLFSMHMFQHLLLSEIVPPLLLLGVPLQWWQWILSWQPLESVEHLLRKPVIAWLCGIVALWLWHWPRLYDAALYNEDLHAFQHLCFMITGTIFWYPVITPVPGHRMTAFPAVFYLFTACTFSSLLGIFITFAAHEIYPFYLSPTDELGILPRLRGLITVQQDQELGGLLMWFPCCLIYASAILIRLGTWLCESPDESEAAFAGATTIAARRAPSPGTPGEGGGEGDLDRKKSPDTPRGFMPIRDTFYTRNHPHPNPLPEYRERG
jgi:cytochrome c oxidase assembly factor CtaG